MLTSRLLWSLLVILSTSTTLDATGDFFALKSKSPSKPRDDPFKLKSHSSSSSSQLNDSGENGSSDLPGFSPTPQNPSKRKSPSTQSGASGTTSTTTTTTTTLPVGSVPPDLIYPTPLVPQLPVQDMQTFTKKDLTENDPKFPVVQTRGYKYFAMPTLTHPLPPPKDLMDVKKTSREYRLSPFIIDGIKMQVIFYPFASADIPRTAFEASLEILEFPAGTPKVCAAFGVTLGLAQKDGDEMFHTEATYREHLFTVQEPRARNVKLLGHHTVNQQAGKGGVISKDKPAEISYQVALVECGADAFGWMRNPATLLKTTNPDDDINTDEYWSIPDILGHGNMKLYEEAVIKKNLDLFKRGRYEYNPDLQMPRKHGSMSTGMALRNPRQVIGEIGLRNPTVRCYKNVIIRMLYSVPAFPRLLMKIADRDDRPSLIKRVFWQLFNPDNDVPADFGTSLGAPTQMGNEAQDDPGVFYNNLLASIEESSRPFKESSPTTSSSTPTIAPRPNRELGSPSREYRELAKLLTFKYRIIKHYPFSSGRLPELRDAETDSALHLTIRGQETLEDAIWAHITATSAHDVIIGDVTDQRGTVNNVMKYLDLPEMLLITLGRFPHVNTNKIHDRFEYPAKFDFSPLLMTPADVRHVANKDHYQDLPDEAPEADSSPYTLKAVICHKGTSASSGHYYVYIRIRNQWFKFDDELITLVDHNEVFDRHYGGPGPIEMEEEEEEEEEPSKEKDPKSGSDKVDTSKTAKKTRPSREYSAYMLLYTSDKADFDGFAAKDIPAYVKASTSSPRAMNVTVTRDGNLPNITIPAKDNTKMSEFFKLAQSKLGATPHEFFLIPVGARHPSRLLSRDGTINNMRLSRIFGETTTPKIFALPVSTPFTPTQRLDYALLTFNYIERLDHFARRIVSRTENLSQFIPSLKAELGVPASTEVSIKYQTQEFRENLDGYGYKSPSLHTTICDCTNRSCFAPKLEDGTLLTLTPTTTTPSTTTPSTTTTKSSGGVPQSGPRRGEGPTFSSGQGSLTGTGPKNPPPSGNGVGKGTPYTSMSGVTTKLPPQSGGLPKERSAPIPEFLDLPIVYRSFATPIKNDSTMLLLRTDKHFEVFERVTESVKSSRNSCKVHLEFDDDLESVQVYPASNAILNNAIVKGQHDLKNLKRVAVTFEHRTTTSSSGSSSSSTSEDAFGLYLGSTPLSAPGLSQSYHQSFGYSPHGRPNSGSSRRGVGANGLPIYDQSRFGDDHKGSPI